MLEGRWIKVNVLLIIFRPVDDRKDVGVRPTFITIFLLGWSRCRVNECGGWNAGRQLFGCIVGFGIRVFLVNAILLVVSLKEGLCVK